MPNIITEGWGLTHDPSDPKYFYITDGSNSVFKCDSAKNFTVLKTHSVK